MIPEVPKSFVTNIRVDLIDIAKIAMFLDEIGYEMHNGTKGKLAAMGVRLAGDHLTKYNVETTEQAIQILRNLNYGESLIRGDRSYRPLLRQLSDEDLHIESNSVTQAQILKAQSILLKSSITSQNDIKKIREDAINSGVLLLANEPEPEPEDIQLKIRTADDEKKDLLKIRTAMSNFSGAPIADES